MENKVKEIAELALPVKILTRGELVAIHESYKLHDLEAFQDGRNRSRGVLKTPSFEDFKNYVLNNSEVGPAPVFVDHKNVSAVAVLNFSQTGFDQGHCDHKAALQLESTVVWQKLNQLKNNKLSQKNFAILLEDWAGVFKATTESGEEIKISEAIHAIRNMKVDVSASTGSNVNNLTESRSILEQVEVNSTVGKVPAYFEISDTAYIGLDEKTIRLRLLTNSANGESNFSLQIVKEELLLNEIVQEFKEKIINLLPDNSVSIGTFESK